MITPERLEGEISRRLRAELGKEEVLSRVPMLQEVIERYLRRPAKLLRPRLLLESAAAYAKGSKGAPEEALFRLATATELLHVFALMHDDRVDASERAGVELPQSAGREVFMLLAGDLLHTLAVQMIQECVTAFSLSRAIPRRVHSVSVRTIAGQAMEVSRYAEGEETPHLEALFELYDLKTGYYSFVAPLIIGALATGEEMATRDAAVLEEVGLLLGRAFQIKDDAEDISDLMADPPEGDLPSWELGLLLAYLLGEGRREEASLLLEPQRRRGVLLEAREDLPLLSWSRRQLRSLLEKAEQRFAALSLEEKVRAPLFDSVLEIAELR
jgi:geranylgeranyl diphosphate synthase type II